MPGVSAQKVEPNAGLPYSSSRRSVAQYWLTRSRCVHASVPGAGSPAGPTQSAADTPVASRATIARAVASACAREVVAAGTGAAAGRTAAARAARNVVSLIARMKVQTRARDETGPARA